MRITVKALAVIILALSAWAVIMWGATRFEGRESNRILRVELGADAAQLTQAVAANDSDGVANNIRMVIRNTYMDYVFIVLYWLTFVSLAILAARMGKRFFAICAALFITTAALSDLLENGAILTAMQVQPFTDSVAVDIAAFSEVKWTFFFLAALLLGMAIAANRRVSAVRRASGGLFIAGAVLGLAGIARNRVSLEFSLAMISLGILLVAAALMLTLWKLYLSIKQTGHVKRLGRIHAHA